MEFIQSSGFHGGEYAGSNTSRLSETVQSGRRVTSHSQIHRERQRCYCLEFSFHKWIKFFRDEIQWLVCIFMTTNDTMKIRQQALPICQWQPARLPTITIQMTIIWIFFKPFQRWCCMQVQEPNASRWAKEFLMHLKGSRNCLPIGPKVHLPIPNPYSLQVICCLSIYHRKLRVEPDCQM